MLSRARTIAFSNYYGGAPPDAERVVVAMGSVCDVAREAVRYTERPRRKSRCRDRAPVPPSSLEHFLKKLPATVRTIAVLDRTKEAGALGEPLFLDVQAAVAASDRDIRVVGGRYGLSSKDVLPEDLLATFAHLAAERPRHNFTLGIIDDVTKLRCRAYPHRRSRTGISPANSGASARTERSARTRALIKIIGDHTDMYAQGYFAYDSKIGRDYDLCTCASAMYRCGGRT